MTSPQLIATARELLDSGKTAAAAACLKAAMRIDPSDLDAHNLVELHRIEGALGPAFGIDGVISPSDEIFRFFANHPSSLNPVRDYLSDGWRTLSELLRITEQLDRKLSHSARFLEFACGYGRFTRHLVKVLPQGALHVSDVMPGSVDFLRERLGVDGFYSTTDPAGLNFPGRYDGIFVLSLFSHLPHATWSAWLARLYDALEPGGMLIFSTHGERSAEVAGVSLPDDGYAFFAESESSTLEGEVYGCTYTSTAYVQRAIACLPGTPRVTRFPAHFWGNQDGYVIIR